MIATGSTIHSDRFRFLEPRRGEADLISNPLRTSGRPPRATYDWLESAREQVSAMADLETGWDSQGADPPETAVLTGADNLLTSLRNSGYVPKPYVYPTRSGGVQLEWERGSRYFEIELVAPDEARFFYSDTEARFESSGTIHEGDSLEEVVVLIRQVVG